MGVVAISARDTEEFLVGKEWDMNTIQLALKVMAGELALARNTPGI